MQQNLQSHQAFLTQAVAAAQQVRQLLDQHALTKGEFVKGEMKAARRQTDVAVAEFYRTLMAMQELMPSASLTALVTQLKGIELYAKQYYIASASGATSNTAGGFGSSDSGSGPGSGSGNSGSDSGSGSSSSGDAGSDGGDE